MPEAALTGARHQRARLHGGVRSIASFVAAGALCAATPAAHARGASLHTPMVQPDQLRLPLFNVKRAIDMLNDERKDECKALLSNKKPCPPVASAKGAPPGDSPGARRIAAIDAAILAMQNVDSACVAATARADSVRPPLDRAIDQHCFRAPTVAGPAQADREFEAAVAAQTMILTSPSADGEQVICSAFRIASAYIATARHCFGAKLPSGWQARSADGRHMFEIGAVHRPSTASPSRVDPDQDWVVLTLCAQHVVGNTARRQPCDVARDPVRPVVWQSAGLGGAVHVVGYLPTPSDRPPLWDPGRIRSPRANACHVTNFGNQSDCFSLLCQEDHGFSGAGLVRRATTADGGFAIGLLGLISGASDSETVRICGGDPSLSVVAVSAAAALASIGIKSETGLVPSK